MLVVVTPQEEAPAVLVNETERFIVVQVEGRRRKFHKENGMEIGFSRMMGMGKAPCRLTGYRSNCAGA